MDERIRHARPASPSSRRRPYVPPTLRVYGAMTALTATGTGMQAESMGMPQPNPTRKMG